MTSQKVFAQKYRFWTKNPKNGYVTYGQTLIKRLRKTLNKKQKQKKTQKGFRPKKSSEPETLQDQKNCSHIKLELT